MAYYPPLRQLVYLQVNEGAQTMTTMNRVMMRWKDDFLKWDNDASLKGVNSIQVKQEDIWVPDITVGNIVLENWHMGFVEHCGFCCLYLPTNGTQLI